MKKIFLTIFSLSSFLTLTAQKNSKLYKEFGIRHQENVNKLTAFLKKDTSRKVDSAAVKLAIQNLATVHNGFPVFWNEEDGGANNASNIPVLQNGGITGQNGAVNGTGINILIMDTGKIFESHQEFGTASRIILKETDAASYSTHSTKVAGMLGAIGVNANAKGVLTNATFENYFFGNTSLGTNYQKLQAATNANISNHSYGTNLGWRLSGSSYYWYGDYELYKTTKQDTFGGSYYTPDADYDKIVYSNPNHIVIKSAGNYYGIGPGTTTGTKYRIDLSTNSWVPFQAGEELPPSNCNNGYYCMGWGALAKNIISVAAANQLTTSGNTYTSPSDISKYSRGSAGPRRDGAIKPDITAVGSIVTVPEFLNTSNTTSITQDAGTSLAAPVISGIAGAMTQINRNITGNSNFIYQADEMKALLTHTANEAGIVGPDVWYGWGIADAGKAAEVVIKKNQNTAIFQQNTLVSGVQNNIEVIAVSGEPLKATISWVDPAAVPFTTNNDLQNNHASQLINDLDLRIIDTVDNTIYYPWKLDVSSPMSPAIKGDNTVDNIEQVLIENPVAGRTYRVVVSNKGQLVNDTGTETPSKYAIVVTGYTQTGLSATETDLKKAVVVHPTRTKENVTVIIPIKAESINVFDISGKIVMKLKAQNQQTINLSSLTPGVYFINIKTENGNITKKIIKE